MHLAAAVTAATTVVVVAMLAFRHWRNNAKRSRDAPWLAAMREILDAAPGRQIDLPVEIMPHLLLGDKRAAGDVATIDAYGITHILNVAGTYGRSAPILSHCLRHYLEIHADDEEGYPILERHLNEASAFIRKARDQGGRCLIHCQAGVNRSACIAVAELLLTERLDILQAVTRAKRARGVLLSNHSFQVALVKLAREAGLLGPTPEVDEAAAKRAMAMRKARPSAKEALRGLG